MFENFTFEKYFCDLYLQLLQVVHTFPDISFGSVFLKMSFGGVF